MLRGPETTDQVGVVDATQHGHLCLQPLQLFLLVSLGVANIADLQRREEMAMAHCLALCPGLRCCFFPTAKEAAREGLSTRVGLGQFGYKFVGIHVQRRINYMVIRTVHALVL